MAALAVDGGDEAVRGDRIGDALRERHVDRAVLEKRRREDHARGAERDECLRPFGRADAAADAAGEPSADGRDERLVRAGVLGGVEVDELHLGVAGEALDPPLDVAGLDREALALHELHDSAALEIDGRNQHQSLVGTPRAARNCFRSATACSE